MGAERRCRLAVCIARLQPPQQRHVDALRALAADHDAVWLVCGGVTQAASVVNPWTFDERRALLALALPPSLDLACLAVADCWYDDRRWADAVREAVLAQAARAGIDPAQADIALVPLERGSASFYAACFPEWRVCEPGADLPAFDRTLNERLLGGDAAAALDASVPVPVRAALAATLSDAVRCELREEMAFITHYRDAWQTAPFPPIFVTVDALVTHGDRVLVIRRGRRPGHGLLALPGGFIDPDEPLCDSALRELREETGLVLPASACTAVRVYDHPHRSLRGRTITHLHRYVLAGTQPAPALEAGDDAAQALWLPFADARPQAFFEDHYAMLQLELGLA